MSIHDDSMTLPALSLKRADKIMPSRERGGGNIKEGAEKGKKEINKVLRASLAATAGEG